MYTLCSGLYAEWTRGEVYNVLVLGLDNAGKTSFVGELAASISPSRRPPRIIPTVGFNVTRVPLTSRITAQCWDLGGKESLRGMWAHYTGEAHALVFVVDASDVDRLVEARSLLVSLLQDPALSQAPVAIVANKQDSPSAHPPADLLDWFGIGELLAPISGSSGAALGTGAGQGAGAGAGATAGGAGEVIRSAPGRAVAAAAAAAAASAAAAAGGQAGYSKLQTSLAAHGSSGMGSTTSVPTLARAQSRAGHPLPPQPGSNGVGAVAGAINTGVSAGAYDDEEERHDFIMLGASTRNGMGVKTLMGWLAEVLPGHPRVEIVAGSGGETGTLPTGAKFV